MKDEKAFIDTNLIVYLYSKNDAEKQKQVIASISNYDCFISTQVLRSSTVKKSLALNERYGYSYYDCLIIASALESNCKYLFSEDMQHGQIIENTLKIVNPFA
ncbi:MAG: PIN domain-containing protein [Fibromonadaceae bacterium]|jgi:predicted nucleic acid-binding protein|nr:PIN domain-containing protein [Fibromonadaceae bacterium]